MKKLSKKEMKTIKGGGHETCGHGSASCNPSPYYNHACVADADCWGPTQTCKGTLYCSPSKTCLFC